MFEQALKQTRQEQQQQEQAFNNNHLIQTLKRQHQELLNLYHRQLSINKIDREQQTVRINQHDSQIQTDLITTQQTQSSSCKQNSQVYAGNSLQKINKIIIYFD